MVRAPGPDAETDRPGPVRESGAEPKNVPPRPWGMDVDADQARVRLWLHPEAGPPTEDLRATLLADPPPGRLLHQNQRHRLHRAELAGHDCVIKRSLPGRRHLPRLARTFARAVALEGDGARWLAQPLALAEYRRAGKRRGYTLIHGFVEGRSLGEHRRRAGDSRLPLEAVAELVSQMSRAGLHCRDFSADNILIREDGQGGPQAVLVDLESLARGTAGPIRRARMLAQLRLSAAQGRQLRTELRRRGVAVSAPLAFLARHCWLPLRDLEQHPRTRAWRARVRQWISPRAGKD